ncbi:peptidoglycan-binding protein [Shimia sp. R9_3]|uniref:peptidoglycan-binding protein n=1 Tax=Shimia sp. R9_3 TaxID=2821113 RepID=UPI001AD9C546|nr:peptidoglycan-binding protein [Shimia sp. R9_3]
MNRPIRPMLGEIELAQVQLVQVDEDQILTRHDIPALEGDFFQRLGRAGTAIELTGVQSGPDAREGLTKLRDAYRAVAPLTFAADIVTATTLDDVLIEHFEISEHAGLPDAFEYRLLLRECPPAPAPDPQEPPEPPEPPEVTEDEGVLVVNVIKEGDPAFAAKNTTVLAAGTLQDGSDFPETALSGQTDTRWTEDPFPAGEFTLRATATGAAADGSDLSGSATATVRAGATTEVTIVLRDAAAIAKRFLVHFRFDSAFVEPCLKQVLKQVADHASAHPDEKMLVVGHTDLVGTKEYNQALSERRARSVFAALRYGNDPVGAVAEWNALRQARTTNLHDNWGTREYQQMLQDRDFYNGRIDGDHGPMTDAAVRHFQAANGLPETGTMNGATWPLLIDAYLAAQALSVPDDRLLPNCPGEGLKWLGCGELDPLRNVTFAWRPNRRTEVLFTRATELPADIDTPVTFALPAPGAVGSDWCLNESSGSARSCFVAPNVKSKRHETCPGTLPRGPAFTREPIEPTPQFKVQGSIRFEDGTPYTGTYFITAPDGEYMAGEREKTSGSARAGTPKTKTPAPDGSFSYDTPLKTPGIFILELEADVIARPSGAPITEAKGPVVCKRLAGPQDRFDVVITDRSVADTRPTLTGPDAVVVARTHSTPARAPLTLGANQAFAGTGTLTLTNGTDRLRVFDAAAGGTELTFDGTDNIFTSDQLTAGVTLFCEGGPNPSATAGDVTATLQLTVGGTAGLSVSHQMTVVRLTLDVALSRPVGGGDAPDMSAADRIAIGRFTQVADPTFSHERTLLRVQPPEPADFTGDLALAPIGPRAALFASEQPAASQAALANPHVIPVASIPATGLALFAEGLDHSAAVRDSGFMLGLSGGEPDGDRAPMTMVRIDAAPDNLPATAAVTASRFGVWDQAYNGAGEFVADIIAADERRLHYRVRDAGAGAGPITVTWRSLLADQATDDDAPASQVLTLPATAAGSGHFISNGVMLVTDDTDAAVAVPSGLPAQPGLAEPRARGQSDHRLRRARIDGFVRTEYSPAAQPGTRLGITLPVFPRNPDERRRISVRVIRYTSATYAPVTDQRIADQFAEANRRWNAVGVQIDAQATVDRAIPAAALDGGGDYGGQANNAFEQAALRDLIPITPDNTLTVVFTSVAGSNAYATVANRAPIPNPPGANLTLDARFFVFIDNTLDVQDVTLGHEMHHIFFNRFDGAANDAFFAFNTNPGTAVGAARGIALPDARIYRRIQNQHSADPDNDPNNDNILNWVRRTRTARQPAQAGPGPAPDATTGNTLVGPF